MTPEEFNERFDAVKYQFLRIKKQYNLIHDKYEWYELAQALMKTGETTDPLVALLTVDRENPSCYSYGKEKRFMK